MRHSTCPESVHSQAEQTDTQTKNTDMVREMLIDMLQSNMGTEISVEMSENHTVWGTVEVALQYLPRVLQ